MDEFFHPVNIFYEPLSGSKEFMCPVSVVKVYDFILKIDLKHNIYYKTHKVKKKSWLASICVKRKTWSAWFFYDNFKNLGFVCRNLPHQELQPPKKSHWINFFSMILSHMTKTKAFLLLSSSLLTFSVFFIPMSLSLSLFCRGICLHFNWSGEEQD